VPLTVALARTDRTDALFRGDVRVAGFDVELLDLSVADIFTRMLHDGAYDASEMSFCYGLMAHARGAPALVTLPVYLSRTFRHNSLFVRADGSVTGPRDLPGKTLAVHDFFAADPLWIRGTLRDQYGVEPRDIHWLQFAYRDRMPLPTPPGYHIERAIGADPTELLLSGRADAIFAPDWPPPYRTGSDQVRPLFQDPLAEEQRYFQETGILPMLHGFVLRRDVHEAQPGLATALYQALVASRDAWYQDVFRSPYNSSGLPLFTSLAIHVRDTMGLDFWPAGLARNEAALRTAISYAAADGLIETEFSPRELFPVELQDT
jgi:4,5-dihydroxyphthalate decarboxylase